MKFILLLLLVGLVYLLVRVALLAGRVRREAARVVGRHRETRHSTDGPVLRTPLGRREKDISDRTRIVEDSRTGSEQSPR